MSAKFIFVTGGVVSSLGKGVASALSRHDRLIHGARGDVVVPGQRLVDEPLVVAQVEVGLSPIVGHEDLAVLERTHRSGIDVQVRIELLHRYLESTGLEKPPK